MGLLPQVFGVLPQSFGLLPQSFGLLPQNFGVLPQSFGLLPQSFGLLPQSLALEPQILTLEGLRPGLPHVSPGQPRASDTLAPVDEELRALEQRATASPDDLEAAVRYGLALSRAGERGRAALVLAGAVDRQPGSESALRALDSVAPGGLDPESAWACAHGDSRNTRRSWVRGPERLDRARRVLLARELDLRSPLAVDARGRLLATYSGGPELARPRARDLAVELEVALDLMGTESEPPSRLVAVPLDGRIESLPGEVPGGWPTLLAGWIVVARDRGVLRWHGAGGQTGGAERVGGWAAGLGHVVVARGKLLEAIALGAPEQARWRFAVATEVLALAVVPGAQVLVREKAALVWLDLVTGERRHEVRLADETLAGFVVGAKGEVFLLNGDGLVGLLPEAPLWQLAGPAVPVALAGARGEVLVVHWLGDDTTRGLDVATGKQLWQSGGDLSQGELRVDARGRVYQRRRDSLVALDGDTGAELSSLEVGGGWRDFAFAGERTIALLRRVGVTRTELVVVGE